MITCKPTWFDNFYSNRPPQQSQKESILQSLQAPRKKPSQRGAVTQQTWISHLTEGSLHLVVEHKPCSSCRLPRKLTLLFAVTVVAKVSKPHGLPYSNVYSTRREWLRPLRRVLIWGFTVTWKEHSRTYSHPNQQDERQGEHFSVCGRDIYHMVIPKLKPSETSMYTSNTWTLPP